MLLKYDRTGIFAGPESNQTTIFADIIEVNYSKTMP